MSLDTHHGRHTYKGASKPVPMRPSAKVIWDDDEIPMIQLHDVEHKPIPKIESCTYEDFLQLLIRQHGTSYLCRPDGTPLQPRCDEQYIMPETPIAPTAIIAPISPPQTPQLPIQNLKRASKGSAIQPILDALATAPMTLGELVDATGLGNKAVKNTLDKMKGKYVQKLSNKSRGNQWVIIGSEPIVVEAPVLIRTRIEAYLAQHGPTTARCLADALGEKERTVSGTLYNPLCRAEKVGMDGDKILWGLPEQKQRGVAI
jgi:hypothetical protein